MNLGFIGFGEAAYALSCAFAKIGAADLSMYACSRTFSYRGKPEDAGVARCASYEELASVCDTFFVTAPNTAALSIAEAMAPYLKEGQLYADLSSASPKLMEEAAAVIEKTGALFADAAMLDNVPRFGNAVPVVVSGSGADAFLKRTAGLLLRVEKIGDKAGEAGAIKMLRALYTKAHLALAFDMLEGAAAYGVEDYVMKSLAETMDSKDFITGMNGRVSGGVIHAARRADELEMAAGMLRDAGLDPRLALTAAEKLREIGRLDLKNRIKATPPSTWKEALTYLIEARTASVLSGEEPADATQPADAAQLNMADEARPQPGDTAK